MKTVDDLTYDEVCKILFYGTDEMIRAATASIIGSKYLQNTEAFRIQLVNKYRDEMEDMMTAKEFIDTQCEFGQQYGIANSTLTDKYIELSGTGRKRSFISGEIDAAIPETVIRATDDFPEMMEKFIYYHGIRLKVDAVDELTEQLAQPWPKYATTIRFDIDGFLITFDNNKDESRWYWDVEQIFVDGKVESHGFTNTLQESARVVAEIIVGSNSVVDVEFSRL